MKQNRENIQASILNREWNSLPTAYYCGVNTTTFANHALNAFGAAGGAIGRAMGLANVTLGSPTAIAAAEVGLEG